MLKAQLDAKSIIPENDFIVIRDSAVIHDALRTLDNLSGNYPEIQNVRKKLRGIYLTLERQRPMLETKDE